LGGARRVANANTGIVRNRTGSPSHSSPPLHRGLDHVQRSARVAMSTVHLGVTGAFGCDHSAAAPNVVDTARGG
jgi:hypothetical protein